MKKTALITGVSGQDGAYLSKLLLNRGYRVIGLSHRGEMGNLRYLEVDKKIELEVGQVNDQAFIERVVKSSQPDELYHLAGLSAPAESWNKVREFTEVNTVGILNILEAVRHLSVKTKIFNAATSEMFGRNHEAGAQSENTAIDPTNPYAVTKVYSYWMSNVYRISYKMFCANGILFNHESPLRDQRFVTRKISEGVAKISRGLQKKLILGNTESTRDWGYAEDYVEAMWLMLQTDEPDSYVISTGITHSIGDFIREAFKVVGSDDYSEYIEIYKALFRPIELANLYGFSKKAQEKLGWKPRTSFEELVRIMVIADLNRIDNQSQS